MIQVTNNSCVHNIFASTKVRIMQEILLHIHSFLRYVVLLLLIIVTFKSIGAYIGKRPFDAMDQKMGLFNLVGLHIQALLGFLIYFFVSPYVQFSGETMKNAETRYWTVEHISMMLLAVILVTISRKKIKNATHDGQRHKLTFIYNGIALLLILVAIAMSKRGII